MTPNNPSLTAHTQQYLETLSLKDITALYNQLCIPRSPENPTEIETPPVKKFSDKPSAIKRFLRLQSAIQSAFQSQPAPLTIRVVDAIAHRDDAIESSPTPTPTPLLQEQQLPLFETTPKNPQQRNDILTTQETAGNAAEVPVNNQKYPTFIKNSAVIRKIEPRCKTYSKRQNGTGTRTLALIPDEGITVHMLSYFGVEQRTVWWLWCEGYLSADDVLWEDTPLATSLSIARWRRSDLYHRLPEGYVVNMGKISYRLSPNRKKFSRVR